MRKKVVAFLSACLIAAVLLVGCESSGESNNDSQGQSNQVVQSTVEKVDVKINVVNKLPSSSDEEDGETSSDQSGEQSSAVEDDFVTPEPIAKDLKSVVSAVKKSVVEFYIDAAGQTLSGSGVVVATSETEGKERSYFVTCHHLVAEALNISRDLVFRAKSFDGEEYTATFVGSDPDSDLSVYSIPSLLDEAVLYYGETVDVGESVIALGNHLGKFGVSVTSGIVSANDCKILSDSGSMSFLQTDAVVNEGCSGGGLFTSTGYLIGITDTSVAAGFEGLIGLSFAVPSRVVASVTSDIVRTYSDESYGYVEGKYNLGFSAANYYPRLFMPAAYVVISELDETGCLYKSGLKVNDRLESMEYNDEVYTITDAEEFAAYIHSLNFGIGDRIVFRIGRGDVPYTITVTVSQYVFGMNK